MTAPIRRNLSQHQPTSWRKFDFSPTYQCSMIFLVIPNFNHHPDAQLCLECTRSAEGRLDETRVIQL